MTSTAPESRVVSAARLRNGESEPADEPTVPTPTDGVFVLPNDHHSFTQAAQEIFSVIAETRTMFIRGQVVVEPIESNQGTILSIVRPEEFRSRLEKYGRILMAFRIDNHGTKGLVQKACPEESAKALLATLECRSLLPKISLVSSAPVLVELGGQLQVVSKGYSPAGGGVLVTRGITPHSMTLSEAVSLVRSLFTDFHFQSAGDESRAIAGLLTPSIKMGRLITGFCPLDVVEADNSQSGKGYMHRLYRAVYDDPGYTIAKKDGGVGGTDESLCSALMSGRPFIELDNLRGTLDSQYLEMVLTCAGSVSVRVPHRGEVMIDASRVTFQATSNGMESTKDLANRSCIVRIRKRPNDYRFKTFPEGDLLAHVQANQPKFIGAVFAVVMEWYRRGRPRSEQANHDFREWATSLDWIVRELFNAAPLMDGHLDAQERISNPALSWLRMVALAVLASRRNDSWLSAVDLLELCVSEPIATPGLERFISDQGPQIVGRLLGKCFKETESLELDGIRIDRNEAKEYDPNHRRVQTRRTYRFALCAPSASSLQLQEKPPQFSESYKVEALDAQSAEPGNSGPAQGTLGLAEPPSNPGIPD